MWGRDRGIPRLRFFLGLLCDLCSTLHSILVGGGVAGNGGGDVVYRRLHANGCMVINGNVFYGILLKYFRENIYISSVLKRYLLFTFSGLEALMSLEFWSAPNSTGCREISF